MMQYSDVPFSLPMLIVFLDQEPYSLNSRPDRMIRVMYLGIGESRLGAFLVRYGQQDCSASDFQV